MAKVLNEQQHHPEADAVHADDVGEEDLRTRALTDRRTSLRAGPRRRPRDGRSWRGRRTPARPLATDTMRPSWRRPPYRFRADNARARRHRIPPRPREPGLSVQRARRNCAIGSDASRDAPTLSAPTSSVEPEAERLDVSRRPVRGLKAHGAEHEERRCRNPHSVATNTSVPRVASPLRRSRQGHRTEDNKCGEGRPRQRPPPEELRLPSRVCSTQSTVIRPAEISDWSRRTTGDLSRQLPRAIDIWSRAVAV